MKKPSLSHILAAALGAAGAATAGSLHAEKSMQMLSFGADPAVLECAQRCAVGAVPALASEDMRAVIVTPDPTQGKPLSLTVGMMRTKMRVE